MELWKKRERDVRTVASPLENRCEERVMNLPPRGYEGGTTLRTRSREGKEGTEGEKKSVSTQRDLPADYAYIK